jgi:lipid-A-disaccharide synthase
VDHVLCSLPFEARWFAQQGCRSTFVGHPYFDEVRRQQFDQKFLDAQRQQPGRLVTLLPGSRTQEVTENLGAMLKAAALVYRQALDTRFAIAAFKPHQARIARELVAKANLPVEIHVRRTPELIHLAECCIAVSGSVSLELLYQTKPTVIVYTVGRFAYWLQSKFRRVKYITLVNLLTASELFPTSVRPYDPASADDANVLFPEYLTCEDKSAELAGHVLRWLTDEQERSHLIGRLTQLKLEVGHGGAASQAAEYILAHCPQRPARVARPHYLPATGAETRWTADKQAA